jgi:hypothetical protein
MKLAVAVASAGGATDADAKAAGAAVTEEAQEPPEELTRGTALLERVAAQAQAQAALDKSLAAAADAEAAGKTGRDVPDDVVDLLRGALVEAHELGLGFLDSATLVQEALQAVGVEVSFDGDEGGSGSGRSDGDGGGGGTKAAAGGSSGDERDDNDGGGGGGGGSPAEDAFANKVRRAQRPKYHWTNFRRLRSAASFAKGAFLRKKQERQYMLRWQQRPLRRSLLQFDEKLFEGSNENDVNKLCTTIFTCLQVSRFTS